MKNRSLHSKISQSLIGLIMMLLCAFVALGNDNDLLNKNFTKAEAQNDLNTYFNLIDSQHGNPYLYISREDFRKLVNQKIEELPEQLSFLEFTNLLAELNQQIRCGHTVARPSKGVYEDAAQNMSFFPYPVAVIEGKLFFDFEAEELPHASEILSINGHASTEMLASFQALTVTDGFIQTKLVREVETKFGYYFYLKYGAHNQFNVQYKTASGELAETVIMANNVQTMMVNQYYRPVFKTHERYIHFTHLDAIDSLRTLVLTLNTFRAQPEWFYDWIMSRYDVQSKQFDFDNLVIDLRHNEGGDRRLLSILYKLVAGKTLSDPSATSTRTLTIAEDYLQSINGSTKPNKVEKAEDFLSEHFAVENSGAYEANVENWYENEFKLDLDLSELNFKGQVYVLISGKTFSAASDLARVLGELDNVKLIGEETGGAHQARTANMLLNYTLPHSQMRLQVPVIYEEFVNANADNGFGRGTFPDHLVTQSLSDLKAHRDTVFEFTLDLIEERSAQGSN